MGTGHCTKATPEGTSIGKHTRGRALISSVNRPKPRGSSVNKPKPRARIEARMLEAFGLLNGSGRKNLNVVQSATCKIMTAARGI
jgi:hypothetical protein